MTNIVYIYSLLLYYTYMSYINYLIVIILSIGLMNDKIVKN